MKEHPLNLYSERKVRRKMPSIAIMGGTDGPARIYLAGGDLGLFRDCFSNIELPISVGELLKELFLSPFGAAFLGMVLIAYLLGNISPSILLAKAKGIDIKREGSGNAGTTNALRVMGKKAGAITLVVDVLKGVAAVLLGGLVCGHLCAMCCVLAAMLGHIWPVFYRFKGGKGVATAFGALLGLNPLLALLALAIVVIVVLISKRMSVGSIVVALVFPALCRLLEPDFALPGCALAILIIVKHRSNLKRLFRGEEPRMSIFKRGE